MFKENFIRLCINKDESPSFVCRKVGITPATFSGWDENSIPRRATLQRISDYFGVTPEDLLRGPEEKPSAPAEPPTPTDPLTNEFLELIDQLTLKELRELKAQMLDMINRRIGN